jgi:light-regulated signal transduction histidine kinase (bacteriophytochrome)
MNKPKGEVRIACVEEGNFWQFSVTDNGPGIEEGYFEKIFQIFQILSIRDETESIGIGLPIVKKIVEMYDGRVWVKSTLGQGSIFFFTLPKERRKEMEYITAGSQTGIIG